MELGNLEKVLRVGEGRRVKRLQEQAAYITSLEPDFEQLSASDLQGKTADFRQRLENGESIDDLVFEAFAAVREARKRASDQRMFDVQLMASPAAARTSSRSTTTSPSVTPSGTSPSSTRSG